MKKIFALLLGAMLFVPLASACTPSDQHKNVHTLWQTFKAQEGISQYFDGNIDFSASIKTQKLNPSSQYYALSYCENLVELSLDNIDQFVGAFLLIPDYNQNSIRKLCTNFENNLVAMQNQIASFETEKQRLEEIVATYGVSTTHALAELEDFMIDISNLAVKANNLQVSFTNAFASLYSLPIDRQTAGSEVDIKASACQIQSRLIDDCVLYSITEHGGVHQNKTNPLYQYLMALSLAMQGPVNTSANYAEWVESYQLFDAEEKMFKNSLNQVNLLQDNSNLTGIQLAHFNKVQNFVNENAGLFVNKTISLLY